MTVVAPGAPAGPGAPPAAALVDWAAAGRVAGWLAARKPLPPGYDPAALTADFEEATARAEGLVAAATGLQAPSGARARVTDRPGWAQANVASIQRLLGPTLTRLDEGRQARTANSPVPAGLQRGLTVAGRAVTGTQLGLVLAWMSTRVLGQYDVLVTEELVEDQDLVYYVGPNIVELEQRHRFDPAEFRLWIALHEVTHRAQFTGVPWLRDHFVALVDEGLEPFTADPGRVVVAVRRAAEEIRSGRSPLDDAGMLGLVAGPEQLEAIRRIQALMSLLEGHGDVTMDRAGADAIPGAARFSDVLRRRREQVRGPTRLLQRLLGLEAKFRQYAEGEHFVHRVEEAGGPGALDKVWRGPEWLPTLTEIREPDAWLARTGGPEEASALSPG